MNPPYTVTETLRLKKAQYCQHMDTKNYPALQTLFLPSARLTFLDPSSAVALAGSQPLDFPSPAAFASRMSRLFANASVGAGELELLAPEGEGEEEGDGDRVSAI
jgi:hypothetical protein